MTDPIEQVREMREELIALTPKANISGEVAIGMAHELLDALEAVLAYHKPKLIHLYSGGEPMPSEICGCGMRFPCKTVSLIASALGEKQ